MTPLRRRLSDGIASGGEGGAELRRELGLGEQAEDRDVARALVHTIAAREMPSVSVSVERCTDPRRIVEDAPVLGADRSFLGRLSTVGVGESSSGDLEAPRPPIHEPPSGLITVDDLDDVRTLVAVLHGGTLWQRRAAVARIADRLVAGRGLSGAQTRQALAALEQSRDVEVAYERQVARERLSGAPGRRARAEAEEWRELAAGVEREVRAFWDGERDNEPVGDLPGEQRAQLLLRVRDMSDVLVAHLGAAAEGMDGSSDRARRLSLLSSLRYAGDPRLIASLRVVLDTEGPDASLEAARALAHIDDPRARPALLAAYERCVVVIERAVLAGALGATGDVRGAAFVRQLLESHDTATLGAALEALETLGAVEDCALVMELLEHDDPAIVQQAVRALGRIGDGRSLAALADLRERTGVSAVWAEVEDALTAIRARMELRGEDSAGAEIVIEPDRSARAERLARRQDPARVRLASWKDYLLGHLWRAVGGVRRAVARFEAAAARRKGWAPPLLSMAMAWVRANRHALALSAFRRALEAERSRVERNPVVMRALTRTFLRRAEDMEQDGRYEIARGLLDEVRALDLRRAPSALRFEVERRHEALKRRERHVE